MDLQEAKEKPCMPKLFEYLGILIYFWSNEHEPIHVHGVYQGMENIIEIHVKNGSVTVIKIRNIPGKKPLPKVQLKEFEGLVKNRADDIVKKWIDYFVWHKKISTERITSKQ